MFLFIILIIFGELFNLVLLKCYYLVFGKHLREHHFTISHYIYFLLFPLLASVIMIFIHGLSVLYAFLIFASIGTILEWLIGFSYHQFVGQRLWTYHRFSLSGYTSLLSIPIWGMAGILFWLLAKALV